MPNRTDYFIVFKTVCQVGQKAPKPEMYASLREALAAARAYVEKPYKPVRYDGVLSGYVTTQKYGPTVQQPLAYVKKNAFDLFLIIPARDECERCAERIMQAD